MEHNTNSSGGSKNSGRRQQNHKSNDLQNITNGVQRLDLNAKLKSPPVQHEGREGRVKVTVAHQIYQQQQSAHVKTKKQGKTGGGEKGTSSGFGKDGLYAGAGFDRSPEASSLPIPKFLSSNKCNTSALTVTNVPTQGSSPTTQKQRTEKYKSINVEELLSGTQNLSCPLPSNHQSPTPSTATLASLPSPSSSTASGEELRKKSATLLKLLNGGQQPKGSSPLAVPKGPPPDTERLEEMTAQVRKLLNL